MKKLKLSWAFAALFMYLLTTPASAQYIYLDANGDGVNTSADSLHATGPTILTIFLDSSHDKSGSAQTCNSHTVSCGAAASGTALDVSSYTILLAATGGTVSWGSFTPADPAYTPFGGVKTTDHDCSIDFQRTFGTVTPAGLFAIGSIPVTAVSGSPGIAIANHPIEADPNFPSTFFGAPHCDGFVLGFSSYLLGDPAVLCSGDWYDADDRVIVEIRERSWLKSAPHDIMDQRTCCVIRFRGDRISEIRDYTDSHIYEAFLKRHRAELPKFATC